MKTTLHLDDSCELFKGSDREALWFSGSYIECLTRDYLSLHNPEPSFEYYWDVHLRMVC